MADDDTTKDDGTVGASEVALAAYAAVGLLISELRASGSIDSERFAKHLRRLKQVRSLNKGVVSSLEALAEIADPPPKAGKD